MVEGQVAAVQAAVGKPAVGTVGVVLQRGQGLAVPGQVLRLVGPERGGIGNRMGVAVLVSHVEENPVLVVIEGRTLSMDPCTGAAMGLKSQPTCKFADNAIAPHNGAKPLE
ncbi:hypothetical protein D3C71_1642260 [compost metagenome]